MATLRNTTISDTGFLQLPAGTTAQRPTPSAGQLRFNTTTGRAEFYNPSVLNWLGTQSRSVIATGGNSVYDVDVEGSTYRVHVFTSTGNSTFTVTQAGRVEYLIVAGGGSGGSGEANPAGDSPGGGGAGGLLTGFVEVTPQAYTITVGNGASTRVSGTSTDGSAGQNSSAFGLTAIGGGAGAREEGPGGAGGSGGGGGGSCISGRKAGGAGTSGQGNAGGTGGDSGCSRRAGAGGGGAGIAGGDDRGNLGGNGGNGIESSITGFRNFYAGGGGGGNSANVSGTPGAGGLGGGGLGGQSTGAAGSPSGAGTDATPNTGGGGGATGSGTSTINGLGGSGIVVVRYPLNQENPVTVSGKVLQAEIDIDFTSSSYPGTGSIVSDTGFGATGTLINSPTANDIKTHRGNFFFNGSNQYIAMSSVELRRDFTLEIWARRNGDVGFSLFGQGIFDISRGMHILYNTGTRGMIFGLYGNDNDYGDNYRPPANTWLHWVFTYNHTTFAKQFYANSVLISPTSSVQTQYLGTGQFNIGAIYSSPQGFANGNIAAARVYNRVLSATEIQQSYNATRWKFGV
jgi:hypothetical protein